MKFFYRFAEPQVFSRYLLLGAVHTHARAHMHLRARLDTRTHSLVAWFNSSPGKYAILQAYKLLQIERPLAHCSFFRGRMYFFVRVMF